MEEERARELVERYGDLLVRLGYTWLGDLDDAQDVCQTVLLKLLEDQRTFPDQGQERAWVICLLMATAGAAVLASPTLRDRVFGGSAGYDQSSAIIGRSVEQSGWTLTLTSGDAIDVRA